MSFARYMDNNISENVSSKYNQKLLDHAEKSGVNPRKTVSKRPIQKTSKATGDLIGNKTPNGITRV